jgi:hypothetical protein
MTFEVPVSTVPRQRDRRGVVAVAVLSGLIVLGAPLSAMLMPGSAQGGATPTVAAPVAAADGAESPRARPSGAAPSQPGIMRVATTRVARPLPDVIACHDIAAGHCERLVRAALRVLPADLPAVRDAAVWDSLVCGDTFDCPPGYLRDSTPEGSVVVRFVDGSPSTAINVVDWRYGSAIRLGLRAWLVRSQPVD